jgi:hypothetical protein
MAESVVKHYELSPTPFIVAMELSKFPPKKLMVKVVHS